MVLIVTIESSNAMISSMPPKMNVSLDSLYANTWKHTSAPRYVTFRELLKRILESLRWRWRRWPAVRSLRSRIFCR